MTVKKTQSINIIGELTEQIYIRMGKYGSLIIFNGPIWVIEEEINEILLDKDLLIKLGINFREQLKQRGGIEVDY